MASYQQGPAINTFDRLGDTSTERFHKNPFLNEETSFKDVADPFAEWPGSFLDRLKQALVPLMAKLTRNVLEDGFTDDDFSVYTGMSGVLLTYVFLSENQPVDPSIKKLMDQFVEEVLAGHMLRKKRFTYLCGDSGPLVVAYFITNDPVQRSKLLSCLLELQESVHAHVSRNGTQTANELLYGRAGYLYALLLLNQEFPQNPPLIPDTVISNVVESIIQDGITHNQMGIPPLHYEWHDKTYLGAAHGYVGILYILLKARAYMKNEHLKCVKETLDWVLSQQLASGNLRSSTESHEDKLVHWCHGAPGAIFLFLQAAKVFETDKERYLKSALACGEVVWHRGILKRSYSLCHGSSGNAYALMALYNYTQDSTWLRRSCLFAQWCFSWGEHSTRQPDRPHSLFEGLAGTVYMLHDFHNFLSKGGSGSGSTPKFPAFELD